MIIFDLDDTLADCEHRRHFVEKDISCDHWHQIPNHSIDACNECKEKWKKWKPDWDAFYEACDKDEPIDTVVTLFHRLILDDFYDFQIWSGRCESVRCKTEYWINNHVAPFQWNSSRLKMRPIGDNTPDNQLKERWLDEAIAEGKTIDFVFSADWGSIQMWRRRGIFVFDCHQPGKEF